MRTPMVMPPPRTACALPNITAACEALPVSCVIP